MRKITRIAGPALAALALAGCGGAGGGGAPPATTDPALCGADRLAGLTGQPVTLLPGDEVGGPLRLIRPGDAVTEDFNPARLNVSLDASDHITRLSCG
ncbi:I78 family peptidase inhibitor [Pseudogemmobacter humi]|uniref:Peptidase inhibitor I78 family protein n=1 Tax=Pseudogemmobacter humi TaxID=2483812 RepID=A0A3P5X7K4_9RHOB|nr:I78 family peptidase inhibitor [Pseudogemmobacter humi]VDC27243.1 Peptidase inhibitor I78 family protein [Pseudogemmobacter humi]